MSGKTERPTPQRMRELRKKGQVPYSRALTSYAALVGATAALVALAPSAVEHFEAWAQSAARLEEASPARALRGALTTLGRFGGAVAGAAAVAAVAAGGVQTGFLFAPSRLALHFASLRPWSTWEQRLRPASWWSGALGGLQLVVGGAATCWAVRRVVVDAHALPIEQGGSGALHSAAGTLVALWGAWCGVGALASLADHAAQRALFESEHRMSKQEIRDEFKRSEGDPEHKARRERAHRELFAETLREAARRTDVVVRNPTHVAVGLRYRPEERDAPTVTMVGRGSAARRIVRAARRRSVPEFQERTTARALAQLDVGDEVPETLFEAVAIVYRWLEQEREPSVDSSA